MSEEVKSPSADELHAIFIRHGRTTDNAKGVISGGVANPDLVPEGRDQAKEANTVYKALEAKGLVNDETPLFTTDRTRAVDTAKLFTGRTEKSVRPYILHCHWLEQYFKNIFVFYFSKIQSLTLYLRITFRVTSQ